MGNPDIIFIQTTLSYGSIGMQNPRRLFFIFSGVLKPKKLEGCFRRKVLEIFHTFKWTWLEPWGTCIHKYRVNVSEQNGSRVSLDKVLIFSCFTTLFKNNIRELCILCNFMGLSICHFAFKMFDADAYAVMKWSITFILWHLYILTKIYYKPPTMDYAFSVAKCTLDADANELVIFIDAC